MDDKSQSKNITPKYGSSTKNNYTNGGGKTILTPYKIPEKPLGATSSPYKSAANTHAATSSPYKSAANTHAATSSPYKNAANTHAATSSPYKSAANKQSGYNNSIGASSSPYNSREGNKLKVNSSPYNLSSPSKSNTNLHPASSRPPPKISLTEVMKNDEETINPKVERKTNNPYQKVSSFPKDTESEEKESFSIKEMIQLRNGISKEVVMKARERNERQNNTSSAPHEPERNVEMFVANETKGRSASMLSNGSIEAEGARERSTSMLSNGSIEAEGARERSASILSNSSIETKGEDNYTKYQESSVSVSAARNLFGNGSSSFDENVKKQLPGKLSSISQSRVVNEVKERTASMSSNSSTEAKADENYTDLDFESSISVSSARNRFSNGSTTNEVVPKQTPGKLSKSFLKNSFSDKHQSGAPPTLPQKPAPGKISKSAFEKPAVEKLVVNEPKQKSPATSPVHVTSERDYDSLIQASPFKRSFNNGRKKQAIRRDNWMPEKYEEPVKNIKDIDTSLESSLNLDSTRSNASATSSQDYALDLTLDLGTSMNDYSDAPLSSQRVYTEESISPQRKDTESMPRENNVSSVRDMFSNKDLFSKTNETVDELPKMNTVSSARTLFQNKTNTEKESEGVSFKSSSSRLPKREDDKLFFQQSRPTSPSKKIGRLTSPDLFFEPKKEHSFVGSASDISASVSTVKEESAFTKESDYETTKSDSDENKRPRTPQDIWEKSQEQFVKNDVEKKEERHDDITSRTHSLMMKQASVSGELPAQVQMAQILGDKKQVGILFKKL